MKERIIKIMEAENLTPSLFADKLNIGRAVISHILNGRNNPSLDVVIRILDTIDYIDADWLLSGKGNMRKGDNISSLVEESSAKPIVQTMPTGLFDTSDQDEAAVPQSSKTIIREESNQAPIAQPTNPPSSVASPVVPILGATSKTVSKVIIYYSDNTFQAFNPDSTPL